LGGPRAKVIAHSVPTLILRQPSFRRVEMFHSFSYEKRLRESESV
jgi:hypothetical protein